MKKTKHTFTTVLCLLLRRGNSKYKGPIYKNSMLAEILTAFYILNITFLFFINVVFKKENSGEIEGGKPGSI